MSPIRKSSRHSADTRGEAQRSVAAEPPDADPRDAVVTEPPDTVASPSSSPASEHLDSNPNCSIQPVVVRQE
jgi:hypothetical protein